MKNQSFVTQVTKISFTRLAQLIALALSFSIISLASYAQDENTPMTANAEQLLQDIRWKSESAVRSTLGDPRSVRGPVGTHASYQIWDYEQFSVAFANERVFHVFDAASLQKIELEETR